MVSDNQITEQKEPEITEYLEFDSKFESGNLLFASAITPSEYNLLLSNDINTK